MLALSSPLARAGLAARDVLVGCVVEGDPRSLDQALRLVQSIRWFGGEMADSPIVVCVLGGLDASSRQAFASCGAEALPVSARERNRAGGDLQLVSRVSGSDREILLLDCGTIVVQNPLPWMRHGLAETAEAEAPAELDFRLDLSNPPPPEGYFAVDPAILRYHDRVDPEGYLLYSPYPFAQVRIEAFNRRLRQEREGRAAAPRVTPPPSAPAARPAAQVVVLGMHRSGTSALTALLRLLGLWAGEEGDFPPADEHNEAGYWEHRGIWAVDEAILQSLGAGWSEVADLDLSRLNQELRARFRKRARETVRELDRHGSWVIKDPRLCVLFPFWREILERPFCVLIHREPVAVARSLAARDGLAILGGIALWEKYMLEALASTRGLPRVLISHRELMADPEATLLRLHRQLELQGASVRIPTAEEIRTILDPALVHHRHEPGTERRHLTLPQLDLLEALDNGTALHLDPLPPLSPGARDLLAAHQSQQAAMRGLRDRLTAQSHRVACLQQVQENLRVSHQDALTAQQDVLASHRKTLATQQELLTAQQEALSEQQEALATSAADLRRALSWLDELDAIFTATLDSRAWKIGRAVTGSLGSLGRLLGRSKISAAERRDRLMNKVRSWRSER
jgi:hypothetical protein